MSPRPFALIAIALAMTHVISGCAFADLRDSGPDTGLRDGQRTDAVTMDIVGMDVPRIDVPGMDIPVPQDVPRVMCRVNGDCPASARFCNPRTQMCVECLAAADCAGMGSDAGTGGDGGFPPLPGRTQCSTATNRCVQCNTGSDCPTGLTCRDSVCECMPDTNGATCAAGTSAPVSPGTMQVFTGNLMPMSTEDWFRLSLPAGAGANIRINLQTEPGSTIVMDLRSDCGVPTYASCTDRMPGADGITVFEFNDSMMMPMSMMPTRNTPWPATLVVRVYSRTPVTTCMRYRLTVQN